MSTMAPDPDTPKGHVEIRDSDGNTLGFFTPASTAQTPIKAKTEALIDCVELARRKAAHKTGRTTREVFERLQSLTQDPDLVTYLQEKIDGLTE